MVSLHRNPPNDKLKILECSVCRGRFSLHAVYEGGYFISGLICSSCCDEMAKSSDSCFGKEYDPEALECRLHCPDRRICPSYFEKKKGSHVHSNDDLEIEDEAQESDSNDVDAEQEEGEPEKKPAIKKKSGIVDVSPPPKKKPAEPTAVAQEERKGKEPAKEQLAEITAEELKQLYGEHVDRFYLLANIFPLMRLEEFNELVRSIDKFGQFEPILTYNDLIADGRNRYLACVWLGRDFRVTKWKETEEKLRQRIVGRNSIRRSLTASQKAAVAAELEKIYAAEAKKRKQAAGKHNLSKGKSLLNEDGLSEAKVSSLGKASAQAAKEVGVSEGYVKEAKRIKNELPEVFQHLKDGQISIQNAVKKLPSNDQTSAPAKSLVHKDGLSEGKLSSRYENAPAATQKQKNPSTKPKKAAKSQPIDKSQPENSLGNAIAQLARFPLAELEPEDLWKELEERDITANDLDNAIAIVGKLKEQSQ